MLKNRVLNPKCLVAIVFMISIECGSAEFNINEINSNSLHFERMKYSLFLSNWTSEVVGETIPLNDLQCLEELQAIGIGLKNSELWALKLVDAWGKVPSGLFFGNTFDFGAFSECFHIKRSGEVYRTKYCLQRIQFGLEGVPNIFDVFYPSLESDDESLLRDHHVFAIDPYVSIGICMPAVCSMEFIQQAVNDGHFINQTNFMKIIGSSCQLEETVSELKTIDWVTIAILSTVLFFIVLSTSYDLIYTVYNRQKSQALLSFSFYTNGKKLLSYKENKSPDVLNCLHGIRSISTQWIVIGHVCIKFMIKPSINKAVAPKFRSEFRSNLATTMSAIAVDTFLLMSGLLVAFSLLKGLERTKGKINVLRLYFHRYLRLTPLFVMIILVSMSLMQFLGNGPMWTSLEANAQRCERNWWSVLLYIQNYYNPRDVCLGPSWYLSVDMQLFMFAPPIVYLMYRFETKAVAPLSLLVLGCIGCTLGTYVKNNTNSFMNDVYFPTHLRFSPWLIGVICGYILFKVRNKRIHIRRLYNLSAWTISLATLIAILYLKWKFELVDIEPTPFEFGLNDGLGRVLWSIALCYIIFACAHGSGGPVNWFLAHPLWQPFSRVSYAMYLLHHPIIAVFLSSSKTPLYVDNLAIWNTFFGVYVVTFFASIIASLAFELPISTLKKLMFDSKKRPSSANQNESNGLYKSYSVGQS